MKNFVRILVVAVALATITIAYSSVTASGDNIQVDGQIISNPAFPDDFDIVAAKKELFDLHKSKYRLFSEQESFKRDTKIDQILTNPDLNEDEKYGLLESYDVYPLLTPTSDYSINSCPSDITVQKPIILFDSATQRWIVTGGGTWKNRNWDYLELRALLAAKPLTMVGVTQNVGGYDLYGIAFTNTSGSYSGVYLHSCSSKITDGQAGGYSITSTSRNTGDACDGVGFLMQDKAVVTKTYWTGWFDYEYVGKSFYVTARYNSEFTNYHGNATTFYQHSFKSTKITGVNLGVSGKTLGIDVNISSEDYQFPAYGSNSPF